MRGREREGGGTRREERAVDVRDGVDGEDDRRVRTRGVSLEWLGKNIVRIAVVCSRGMDA